MKLTKSEFMKGRKCHQRVVHGRNGILSKNDESIMTDELADNGHIIHYLFRKLWQGTPVGVSLEQLVDEAPASSHEVRLSASGFEARADKIHVNDRTIQLLEVKSEKYPTDKEGNAVELFNAHGGVSTDFAELVADVTYQALILEEMLASMPTKHADPRAVQYMLAMLHPRYATRDSVLRQTFDVSNGVVHHSKEPGPTELLRMFVYLDVTEAVRMMMPIIEAERREMLRKIDQQETPVLSSKCKSCEYRTTIYGEEPNGFLGCWQDLTFTSPHILDVPNVHLLKINGEDAVSVLAGQGRASVADLPLDTLKSGYNSIQQRVIYGLLSGEEQQEPELVQLLANCAAPHAFIDVEAFSGPLSLWPGGYPYEVSAFQWSCHTLDSDGVLSHREWLHEGPEHPAATFLTSMYDVLGSAGTVYIWSGYERTAVSHALKAASRLQQEVSPETLAWANAFINDENPNVVDMLALAQRYYVHPGAKGSNSIKKVLDAIWKQHHVRFLPQFEQYYEKIDGFVKSPYDTLPVDYGSARLATIRDGTQAMVAYQDMLYGKGREHADVRDSLRHALLEYCKLDTAAMVIIHQAWLARREES